MPDLTETDTQTEYRNPRCACELRVNEQANAGLQRIKSQLAYMAADNYVSLMFVSVYDYRNMIIIERLCV